MMQSSSGGAPQPPRSMDCAAARVSLGVYVLGAIDPAERSLVDAHLATCRDCRDELAGLAGLPALLARVSREEAAALATADGPFPGSLPEVPEPPRELLATVLDLTAARRRRRRWREAAVAVAAALVIAAGVFGGLRLGSSPAQPAATAAGPYVGNPNGPWQTAAGKTGGAAATISYRSMGWGTQLDTKVTGIPIGTTCGLWITDAAGKRVLAGDWITDAAEGTVWYPGSAAVPAKDVTSFEITVGKGQAIEIPA